ncbi:MAG: signal peptide peptidase SppA [archaeon]|jgi:protease-4
MIKKKVSAPVLSDVNFTKLGIILIGLFLVFVVFLGSLVFVVNAASPSIAPKVDFSSDKVALIKISGELSTESSLSLFSGASGTSSSEIVGYLDEIKNDSSIKGVIFEINSPGGSGVASDEIAQAIRDLNKPTVSFVRELGASGAYWVASETDYIFANRASLVGSIGVISGWLDYSDLLSDFNVKYQRFVAGADKDFGTPYRHVTPEEEARFQAQLDELHTVFIQQVAKGRNLDESYVRKYADGFVMTGQEAVNAKFVDALGGKKEAIAYMEERLGNKIEVTNYSYAPTLFDSIFGYSNELSKSIGTGIGEVLFKQSQSLAIRT